MRRAYEDARHAYVVRRKQSAVRRMHDLEKEIGRIRSLPENAGRLQLIKSLEKQLAELRLEMPN